MRNVSIIVIAAVAVLFSLGSRGNASMLEVDIGPDEIILKSTEGRKPALFPHRSHQDKYSCSECHHVLEQVMTIGKCARCHNETMENMSLNSLKNAGHTLCKNCHSEARKKGLDAPTRCGSCHSVKNQ